MPDDDESTFELTHRQIDYLLRLIGLLAEAPAHERQPDDPTIRVRLRRDQGVALLEIINCFGNPCHEALVDRLTLARKKSVQ